MRGRGRGRARGARGRRGGMTRGRAKKNVKVIESDEDEVQQEIMIETHDENFPPVKIDMEADISQLEAPTFTTLNRGPPEPMLRLRWDHRVSLIGEKVLNPMIHCCDKCLKPILIYGRMIPCKHVFCLPCAREEDKACPRCMYSVTRVEQTGLGTVFMCTHGGTRYGNSGCRRTYLSQRDLQAHINHRHAVGEVEQVPAKVAPLVVPQQPQRKISQASSQNDPRNEQSPLQYRNQARTNLITVPIQQDQPPPPPPPVNVYHQNTVVPTAAAGTSTAGGPPPPPPNSGTPGYASTTPTGGYVTGGYTPAAPPPPAAYYQQAPQYQPQPAAYAEQNQYWAPHPPPPMHQFYR